MELYHPTTTKNRGVVFGQVLGIDNAYELAATAHDHFDVGVVGFNDQLLMVSLDLEDYGAGE